MKRGTIENDFMKSVLKVNPTISSGEMGRLLNDFKKRNQIIA